MPVDKAKVYPRSPKTNENTESFIVRKERAMRVLRNSTELITLIVTRESAVLPAIVLSLMLGTSQVQAQSTPVTSCGQVLSSPGQYHLTGNLGPCLANGVVIAANDIHFTLAGFTISGASSAESCDLTNPQYGVSVAGAVSGIRISGGTVSGFVDGIVLNSVSETRVSAMTITRNCVFGVAVSNSRKVELDTNVVARNGVDGVGIGGSAEEINVHSNYIAENSRVGIDVSASSNLGRTLANIRSNIITGNGGSGIAIFSGSENNIRDNAVIGNFDGIFLSTAVTGNSIQGNTVNGNSNAGIVIVATAAQNSVKGNTARGNGIFDLSDLNPNCGTNAWKNNMFGTSNQGCVQ